MTTRLSARRLPAWIDPAVIYVSWLAGAERSFWLDAGPDASAGWSWLGVGAAPADPPRATRCTDTSVTAPGGPFRGGWVGWLGYDRAAGEAGAPMTDDPAAPQEAGMRADRFVAADHATKTLWAFAPPGEIDGFAADISSRAGVHTPPSPAPPLTAEVPVRARHSASEYASLIERCREAIREGDAYQLCLTTRFEVDGHVDPVLTYLRLRQLTPAHHGGIIRSGEHCLLSASPEQFIEITGDIVRTRPIKGTRPRHLDPEVDAALAQELRSSTKEQAENVMIVDLMRNDLQRVCRPGTVATERLLETEGYAAVHQLVSTVAGRLKPDTRIGDVLGGTFPAGSMTGAPKLSAMSLLHEIETGPRGVFAGCFGWIGDDGDADLAMVIRSIVIHPDGAYVGAGGGITWFSDADAEVAEVAVKARGPLSAVGGALPRGW